MKTVFFGYLLSSSRTSTHTHLNINLRPTTNLLKLIVCFTICFLILFHLLLHTLFQCESLEQQSSVFYREIEKKYLRTPEPEILVK